VLIPKPGRLADTGSMSTNPSRHDRSTPLSAWTAVLAWGALVLSVPLLATAAWFAYVAATDTSPFGGLVILVTVAITVPVVPAAALAIVALRMTDRRRARFLAVIAALLVVSTPLWGIWLGLA
jgi:hypothetical protein